MSDLSQGRFLYIVRPFEAQWELEFGERGSQFLYASQDEALEAERHAARLHWLELSHPSGVAVCETDVRRTIDYFGNWV
jgi:hypothetical protein